MNTANPPLVTPLGHWHGTDMPAGVLKLCHIRQRMGVERGRGAEQEGARVCEQGGRWLSAGQRIGRLEAARKQNKRPSAGLLKPASMWLSCVLYWSRGGGAVKVGRSRKERKTVSAEGVASQLQHVWVGLGGLVLHNSSVLGGATDLFRGFFGLLFFFQTETKCLGKLIIQRLRSHKCVGGQKHWQACSTKSLWKRILSHCNKKKNNCNGENDSNKIF